jgi:hypothetical protein
LVVYENGEMTEYLVVPQRLIHRGQGRGSVQGGAIWIQMPRNFTDRSASVDLPHGRNLQIAGSSAFQRRR